MWHAKKFLLEYQNTMTKLLQGFTGSQDGTQPVPTIDRVPTRIAPSLPEIVEFDPSGARIYPWGLVASANT